MLQALRENYIGCKPFRQDIAFAVPRHWMCPKASHSWKHGASVEHRYSLFHICFVLRFIIRICPHQATANAQAAAHAGVAGVQAKPLRERVLLGLQLHIVAHD